MPPFSETELNILLRVTNTLGTMLSDDLGSDVVEIDFEAIYHGDVLVEGDTSEQLDDWHPLATAV